MAVLSFRSSTDNLCERERRKENSLGGRDVRMVVEVIVSLTTDGMGENHRYLVNSDA